jgi:hypothetical protein
LLLVVLATGAAVVLLVALAGSFREPASDAYLSRNAAILDQLPIFPGARQRADTVAAPERSADVPRAPVVGYWSSRTYLFPSDASAREVIDFYREALRERGWRLVQESEAPSLSLRQGAAYLHLLSGIDEAYVVEVDHDFCGRDPELCVRTTPPARG